MMILGLLALFGGIAIYNRLVGLSNSLQTERQDADDRYRRLLSKLETMEREIAEIRYRRQ